jgi:hypothetical protein
LVSVVLVIPVFVPVNTTLAPGTIAPVLSVTLPSIELLNCANAAPEHTKSTIRSQKPLVIPLFIVPPYLASENLLSGTFSGTGRRLEE